MCQGGAVPRIEVTRRVDVGIEAAFAMSQSRGDVRYAWDPFVREQHLLGGAEHPARGVQTRTTSRHRLSMTSEYTSFRPPTQVGMKMIDGPWFFSAFGGGWSFTEVGPGATDATWRYTFTVRPPWLASIGDRIGRVLLRRDIERRIDGSGARCSWPITGWRPSSPTRPGSTTPPTSTPSWSPAGSTPARSSWPGTRAGAGWPHRSWVSCGTVRCPHRPRSSCSHRRWTSTSTKPSVIDNADRDILPWNIPVTSYLHGVQPNDARVSATFADPEWFPPTFAALGSDEMFRDGIIAFTQGLEVAGVDTDTHEEEGMFHVFPIVMPWSGAAKRVFAAMDDFVSTHITATDPVVLGDGPEAATT